MRPRSSEKKKNLVFHSNIQAVNYHNLYGRYVTGDNHKIHHNYLGLLLSLLVFGSARLVARNAHLKKGNPELSKRKHFYAHERRKKVAV